MSTDIATKQDIAQLEQATKADIALLRKDTNALVLQAKHEIIKWFVGGLFLNAGLVIAGVGILVPVIVNSLN